MSSSGAGGPAAEQTRDDTDVGWGGPYDDGRDQEGRDADPDGDRRLLEERPPHHDRP